MNMADAGPRASAVEPPEFGPRTSDLGPGTRSHLLAQGSWSRGL